MSLSFKLAIPIAIAVLILVGFLGMGPRPLAAAQLATPINLTHDAASETVPSVAVSKSGDVVVSWELNKNPNKKPQEIYASVAPGGGSFGPAVNISNDAYPSRDAYLFPADQSNVYMLYRDTLGRSGYSILSSVWNGTNWSAPTTLANSDYPDSVDPMGVQATDGSIWFVRQVFEGKTWTDALAQKIGGAVYNLSNDGSAVIRPSITAADNGALYASWVDHANERKHTTPGIHVMQWNGTTWTNLPPPNQEADAQFPRLAYNNGQLYIVWRSVHPKWCIKERVWNGSAWGPTLVVAQKSGINYPRLAVSADGNVFVAWEVGGAIYLQENSNTPILVSAGIPNSHQPALFVDSSDVAHVAFENGDIWYTTITFP